MIAQVDPNTIIDAVKSLGPALASVLVVVWIFVRYLHRSTEETRKASRARDDWFIAALRHQTEESTKTAEQCHQVQQRALDSIDSNTEALSQLKESTRSTDQTLREVRDLVARRNGGGH